jgi:hypothetical protein
VELEAAILDQNVDLHHRLPEELRSPEQQVGHLLAVFGSPVGDTAFDEVLGVRHRLVGCRQQLGEVLVFDGAATAHGDRMPDDRAGSAKELAGRDHLP